MRPASHSCSKFYVNSVLVISYPKLFLIGFYFPSIQGLILLYQFDYKEGLFCSEKKNKKQKQNQKAKTNKQTKKLHIKVTRLS